jgi:hypothetical protein
MRRNQLWNSILRHQKQSLDINAEEPLEIGEFRILNAADETDSGVIHQNVKSLDSAERSAYRFFVRYVTLDGSSGWQFPSQRFRLRFSDIAYNYRRSRPRENAANGFTYPTCAACHQRNLAVQPEGLMHVPDYKPLVTAT